jgi:enoyl-CoA hydratase
MTASMVKVTTYNSVALVSFDRGKRYNALNFDLIDELTATADALSRDLSVRAIVLTGTADAFSAGMDLHEQGEDAPVRGPMLSARDQMLKGQKLCRVWEELPQPTIAAIEGPCVGAGIALGLACDWRVMAENAYLYVPELLVGINLGWQSIPRLINLVGPSKAKEIVILCDRMTAQQALEAGLINRVANKGMAVEAALKLATRAAEMPPVAVRMVKQAINASANVLNAATSYMDADQALLCVRGKDFDEGVAAFQENRKPHFTGE